VHDLITARIWAQRPNWPHAAPSPPLPATAPSRNAGLLMCAWPRDATSAPPWSGHRGYFPPEASDRYTRPPHRQMTASAVLRTGRSVRVHGNEPRQCQPREIGVRESVGWTLCLTL